VSRQREAEVGLGKRGDSTAEGGGHVRGGLIVGLNRDEGALVEVDDQARSGRKGIQNLLEVDHMLRNGSDDDKGVVRVLNYRAEQIINKGMEEQPLPRGLKEHLLENISNNVKEEGGEGVTLSQPPAALDPASRNAVEKHSGLAGFIEHPDPGAPDFRESFCQKDFVQSIPADRVEGLTEVQLKDSSRGVALMTSLDDVSSIDKVFSNRASGNKAHLVWVNQERNKLPKAKSKALGVDLEATVLKRYGTEVVRFVSTLFFRKKDNVGLVNGPEICG
jgi:hypothetical protein